MRDLEERLGYEFHIPALLDEALSHSSFAAESTGGVPSNEILEFLGDAVLGLAVTRWLVENCPERSEGELTRLRAAVVNQQSLASAAKSLLLGDYLQVGKAERQTGLQHLPSVLAGVLEAVIGAVYLDSGWEEAHGFVLRHLRGRMEEVVADESFCEDYKSSLQVWAQAERGALPVYQIVDEEGPDHSKIFTAEVYVGEELLGKGRGPSKKQAEQSAARLALARVEGTRTDECSQSAGA